MPAARPARLPDPIVEKMIKILTMTFLANDLVIRPVSPADADALRDIRVEALRRHPIAFTADLVEAEQRSMGSWGEQIAVSMGDRSAVIMVADADGRLAGLAGVVTPQQPKLAHSGIVWGVYVREAFRRQGVAQRLLDACIQWARGKGSSCSSSAPSMKTAARSSAMSARDSSRMASNHVPCNGKAASTTRH